MMELKTKYMKKQQTTLSKDLKRFQLLLYRNFKDYENDDGMGLLAIKWLNYVVQPKLTS